MMWADGAGTVAVSWNLRRTSRAARMDVWIGHRPTESSEGFRPDRIQLGGAIGAERTPDV
jgi:hypothetical protein